MPAGQVLVVRPTDTTRWQLPGSRAERDLSPAAAATRELGESLGITRELHGLLGIDYVLADASRAEELNVVFDGGTLPDPVEFRLPPDRFSDIRFVEPDRLGEYLPGLQSRRIGVALRARFDRRRPTRRTGACTRCRRATGTS